MAATTARRHTAGTRSRPPARRRAGRGGVRWDRVARVSLLVVLALIVASYVGPAASYLEAWRLAKETRAEVNELRHDNDRLRARARRLASSETVELEARRAGMGRPGEQVYVVRGLPAER